MVVVFFICPVICLYLAKLKNRNAFLAFFLGFLIIPTIYYALVEPKGRIKDLREKNDKSEFRECESCGEIYLLVNKCPSCGETERRILKIKDIEEKINSALSGSSE